MVYLRFPANIPNLPGHSWPNAVAIATPIAHKGSTAGAKVQATTALDFLLGPELVKQAWTYFNDVQTKDTKYTPLIGPSDQPTLDLNKDKMERCIATFLGRSPSRFRRGLLCLVVLPGETSSSIKLFLITDGEAFHSPDPGPSRLDREGEYVRRFTAPFWSVYSS